MASNQNSDNENKGKVGSDPKAAENFAEKHDFGIPSEDAAPDMTVEDRDFPGRPAGNKKTRSGAPGRRTVGVGSTEGPDGKGSGGEFFIFERVGQGVDIQNFAAGSVDEERVRFHHGQLARADHIFIAGQHGDVKGKDV